VKPTHEARGVSVSQQNNGLFCSLSFVYSFMYAFEHFLWSRVKTTQQCFASPSDVGTIFFIVHMHIYVHYTSMVQKQVILWFFGELSYGKYLST